MLLLVLLALGGVEALSLEHYRQSCPKAEAAVTAAVKQAMSSDHTVPAALLRLHFHDCFVRVRACCMHLHCSFHPGVAS